jgi:hypothetical protein
VKQVEPCQLRRPELEPYLRAEAGHLPDGNHDLPPVQNALVHDEPSDFSRVTV